MAMHIDSLARVYAQSLFELAEQAGGQAKIVEVNDELEQIVDLASADRALREFLRSPIVERKSRGEVIRRVFSDKVTDLTLRFLLVLNMKGRLAHLGAIAAAYDRLVQESFGRVEVDVYTPGPIDSQQLAMIRQRVQEALGREPVLYPYTDPSMIGGIRLRIGDQLIDASVATRLRRFREHLLTGGSAALRGRLGRFLSEEGQSPQQEQSS